MLIEFRVSNYRSFDEEVVFSMAAAPRLKKKENTFQPNLKDDPLPPLLKTAAIYGPNASGKSNFVRALKTIRELIIFYGANKTDVIDTQTNQTSAANKNKPSKFEVHFFHSGSRYEFGLWLTPERVEREWLKIFPLGQEVLLYSRIYDLSKNSYAYEFGDALLGGRDLHELWAKAVSSVGLFLTVAVVNSNTELQQLRAPFEWFEMTLLVIDKPEMEFERTWSVKVLAESASSEEDLKEIATFLSDVDIPIESVSIEKRSSRTKDDDFSVFFTHRYGEKLVKFHLSDESEGTQNLFSIASTWLMCQGYFESVLVFDEFDSSLHPSIVAKLVARQCSNSGNAQFIFTTHDTHLMDAKILRRDQFWLMERDRKGASKLSSIYDYVGREGEDLEKRYYEGRYRALPILVD